MFFRRNTAFCLLAAAALLPVSAQEVASPTEPTEAVETTPPIILRGTMKNVLTDPMARLPFGAAQTLRAPIAVHFPEKKAAFCWDATTCRLVAAWNGEFMKTDAVGVVSEPAGDLTYLAEGPPLFSAAVGAYGQPKYFGFKLNGGIPTFYYSVGRLGIQETISFSDDGATLKQLIKIENAPGEVMLVLPESWNGRITAKKGKPKGRFLTLTKGEAAEFSLSYSLKPPVAGPEINPDAASPKPDEN